MTRTLRWVLFLGLFALVGAAIGTWYQSRQPGPAQVSDRGVVQAPNGPAFDAVTATISVGVKPWAVVSDPKGGTAYVVNQGSGTVSAVKTMDNQLVATIRVGPMPVAAAIDGVGHLWVVNNGDDTISVVDVGRQSVVETIHVGHGPTGIAIGGATAIVTNFADNTASLVDVASHTVTATVPVGAHPCAVAADETHAYVANNGDGTLSAVSLKDQTTTTVNGVGHTPYAIALDSAAHRAYVTDVSGDAVVVVDTVTHAVLSTAKVGRGPEGVAIDPGQRLGYVAVGNSAVVILDLSTGQTKGSVTVGASPAGVAVDAVSHAAVVANSGDRTITVVTH